MRNILEIIKKMPEGRCLYSTIYGTLNFKGIENSSILYPIRALYTYNDGEKDEASFTEDGRFQERRYAVYGSPRHNGRNES